VPEEIGELVWLEGLSFASRWWEWDGHAWSIQQTINSKKSEGHNRIAYLPAIFSKLQKLKRLFLNGSGDYYDLSPLASLRELQDLTTTG